MSPADRLKRASELLDQAVHELEDAEERTPHYVVGSLHFLRAELKVARRRIHNVRKALGARPDG